MEASVKLSDKPKRRHMILLLKRPMKIRQISKTNGQGNIQNRDVSLFELFYGFLQAQVVDILYAGHIHVFFEKAHEMIVAEIADCGKLRDRDRLRVMSFDIVEHLLELVGGYSCIGSSSLLTVLQQQEDSLQEQGFQGQFIARYRLVVQRSDLVENLMQRDVGGMRPGNQKGHGDLLIHHRRQVACGADVRGIPAQEIQMKYIGFRTDFPGAS